ncbi:MAG TPA: hypothetical protein PK268_01390 [Enterococcus sp.]|nr:hypothetical protein [Enterococcus sp.]HPR80560.1 hypothetical protein [Enterococcus sp.]
MLFSSLVLLSLVFVGNVTVLGDTLDDANNISNLSQEKILYDQGTFEETSNLPLVPSTEFIESNFVGPTLAKAKSPSSIADYKN